MEIKLKKKKNYPKQVISLTRVWDRHWVSRAPGSARPMDKYLNALLSSFPENALHAYKINIHAKLMLILVPLRVLHFAIQFAIKKKDKKR